jgi:hypothetical protein
MASLKSENTYCPTLRGDGFRPPFYSQGLSDFAAKYVTGFLRGGSDEHIPPRNQRPQLDA